MSLTNNYLKKSLIRLGNENPAIRPEIREVLSYMPKTARRGSGGEWHVNPSEMYVRNYVSGQGLFPGDLTRPQTRMVREIKKFLTVIKERVPSLTYTISPEPLDVDRKSIVISHQIKYKVKKSELEAFQISLIEERDRFGVDFLYLYW